VARTLGVACFTADTRVVVGRNADGTLLTRPISELHVGDLVLTRNADAADDELELKPITEVHVHTTNHLRVLTVASSTGDLELIRTTDEHPFYVPDRGFVPAADLRPGDHLLQPDGALACLVSSTSESHPEGIAVYNLTVDGDHTYFVDDAVDGGAVWVHNRCSALRSALKKAGVWGMGHGRDGAGGTPRPKVWILV
jgi:hypothetical protein